MIACRTRIFAILCLASACSAKDDENASTATPHQRAKPVPVSATPVSDERYRTIFTPAVRVGTWYRAGAFRVRSVAPGVSIAPTPDLPVISYEKGDDPYCPTIARAETPAGKQARSLGWRVGNEGSFGPLTIVSVLRKAVHGPGGECQAIDGRLLLFDHGRPIATIVTVSPDSYQFGSWKKTTRGALRLETGLREPPYGDLYIQEQDIDIEPLPPSDTGCNGQKTVPNIFGKPIKDAREILRRAGWEPIPMHRQPPVVNSNGMGDVWVEEDYFYRDGITEVTNCDHRGLCVFQYRSGRATVVVYTQGEPVTAYDLNCVDRRLKPGMQLP